MNTQKVTITIPKDLLVMIDKISHQRNISRSAYITSVLREKILAEKETQLKKAYDRVFSDESIQKEQIETSGWFHENEAKEGQEW